MIEFDKGENITQIIEREQTKHLNPLGYTDIDIKAVSEFSDTVKNAIDRIAKEIQKESDLYIICEMAP